MNNPYDILDSLVSGLDPLVSGEDPMVGALALRRLQQIQKPQPTAIDMANLATRAKVGDAPATFLGIGSTTVAVAAGATTVFTATPTNPIRVTNFTVPSSIAATFVIGGLFVGRLNMLQSGQPVPADRFTKDSQRAPFEAPVVNAGTPISVSVTNMTGADAFFVASFDAVDLVQGV